MRRRAIVVLLGLALLALAACSNSSPTATVPPEPSATPQIDATVATTPTRSGAAPLPTATATVAPARPTATATVARSASPVAAGTALPTLAAGQVYKDPQSRFSFTIPGNWTQVAAAGAEIAFQSPVPAGVVPATVNVVLEKLPSASVTLDEYDQAGEANLKQQFPDYKAVALTKVTVDGKAAYKRVYTATIAGRLLQLQQVYLIEKDVAYVISCGAPQENFAANTAVFDQISGTFKIGAR